MDRVARDLQAALLKGNRDDVKEKFTILSENLMGKISSSVDVLDLCDKGVLKSVFLFMVVFPRHIPPIIFPLGESNLIDIAFSFL